MKIVESIQKLRSESRLLYTRLREPQKLQFTCPICHYSGSFLDIASAAGNRQHAECPKCNSLERHRLQYLVVEKVLRSIDTRHLRALHFAPEPFLRSNFSARFGRYETADLYMPSVDHKVDLQDIPFEDSSYDFVFASHVLEHIQNDAKAISEVRRILRPGGIAILPVPLVAAETIEYFRPIETEYGHVRAPGLDYFDRYRRFFSTVETYRSTSFPEENQLYVYEDRTRWPSRECPLRIAMIGERHSDAVPVCIA